MNLKRIDALFSYLAIPFAYIFRLLFFFKKPAEKILMVRPGGMGDLIALTHALKELDLRYSNYHWLIEKRSEPWAKFLKLDYSCYDQKPLRTFLKHVSHYREVINTEQRFGLSQVYAIACKHPEGTLTSFDTNRLAFLSHNKIPYDPRKTHEVLSFARIYNPHIALSPLMKNAINQDSDYSIMWIAGGNSPSRTMEVSDFVSLSKSCPTKKLHIISAPEDREFAFLVHEEIKENFSESEVLEGDFQDACHKLEKARCLLTVDSSPVHIASFMGIQTHAIFTSGIINKWHPLTNESLIFRNPEAQCAPCTLFGQVPPCPHLYLCRSIDYNHPLHAEEFCPISK